MDMTGTETIAAPRVRVWEALNDAEVLRACIPGCETLEKLSDTEMKATVTLRVGPIKATFRGQVVISEMDPPNAYTISGEGSGGVAGSAKGSARLMLEESDNSTVQSYSVSSQVSGKIAQLGSRLIDATAKKLASEFFAKFNSVVSSSRSELLSL